MKKSLLLTYGVFLFLHSEVKIEDCSSIESDQKRLACYDYLVTGKSKTPQKTNIIINQNSNSTNQTIAEQSFGLNQRQMSQRGLSENSISLMSSILNVTSTFSGKTRFKLKNDQTWESQSNISTKKNSFREKTDIIIEEATMGGFWMISKNNKMRIKVKRIS